MRLFLAIFMSATLLAAASLGGYRLVWQVHKLAQSASREEQRCDATKLMATDIMKNKHLAFLSTSIDDNGQVYMYFIGKTGDWEVLNVLPNGSRACVFMQGTDWQFILPGNIKIKNTLKPKH